MHITNNLNRRSAIPRYFMADRLKCEVPAFPLVVRLAGVTFGDAQRNIKSFGSPHIGWYPLIREPDNPYDPNAIRVCFGCHYFMGYIPRQIASKLAPLMDIGWELDAQFVCINAHPIYDVVGLTVRITEADG